MEKTAFDRDVFWWPEMFRIFWGYFLCQKFNLARRRQSFSNYLSCESKRNVFFKSWNCWEFSGNSLLAWTSMCKDWFSQISCLTDTSSSEVASTCWACPGKGFDNSVLSEAVPHTDSTEHNPNC